MSSSSSVAPRADNIQLIQVDLNLPYPYSDEDSEELTLAPPPHVLRNLPENNTQWDIIKTLTESDVGNHSRLLIPKIKVHHILKHLSVEEKQQVYSPDGLSVKVLDVDTGSEHMLTFKVLLSSEAHVLNGQWIKDFVNPRQLRRGSVIGLRLWNEPGEEKKLLFKVLTQ